jgi:hypothetical protein
MLRTVPIFAFAFTVSVAALVLSAKRPAPASHAAQGRVAGADAWFV